MLTSFPEEWQIVTGSEFVVDPKSDIVDGPFGSNLKASEYTDSGIPIARIQNVKRFNFVDKNIRFVTTEKAEELHRHSFVQGDILITKLGDPLGLACEVPESFDYGIIVADLVRLRPNLEVCAKPHLIYLLNSDLVIKQIETHVKGTTRPRINLGVIRNLSLPLAPLAEQKIIADKLDTLLAQVETTKARLERIPEILKTFRQSVLAVALSGKLTEQWRIENSEKIKWPKEKSKLGELTELAYGKSLPAKFRSGEGFPVYGSNGVVGFHDTYLVDGPFIIVGRKGSYGEVNWSSESGWPIDTTYFINLKKIANLKFVFYLLKTLGLNQLNRSTAIPGLNREDAYKQLIFIPELKEQTEIVRRVEELFAFTDRIEQKANVALERVNNLTQSILAKAFRGELTSDWRAANPELISGENSVDALLVRIKAEREALKSKPRPKRTTVKKKSGSRMSKKITKVTDALKQAGKPLTGQQLLAEAGYTSDSNTEQLEQFFLDIREALTDEKSIVKLERHKDGQDVFALAEKEEPNKVKR